MRRSRIGALRHRLRLEAPVRTSTEGGAATETWVEVATLFASLVPRAGRESFEAHAHRGEHVFDVRFRYRPTVTTDMRLVLGDRIFNILSVADEGERRRWTHCTAREVTR
ncbi:MAG: phage head closure protein [Pseudomonadota bacterium]